MVKKKKESNNIVDIFFIFLAVVALFVGINFKTVQAVTIDWAETRPVGDTDKTWKSLAMDADGSNLIASTYSRYVYISSDSGTSWSARQPAVDTNKYWYIVASDNDGSNLMVAAQNSRLYTSSDYGVNWTERQPAGDVNKYWYSIASDADGSNLIAAVYDGRVYTSSDSGVSWTERQPAGDTDKNWYTVASDADGSNLMAAVSGGRVYTSSDSGVSWTERQPAGNVNKNWSTVFSDVDGSNLMAAVIGGRLYTSSDSGVSWTERQPAGDNNKNWTSVSSDDVGLNLIAGEVPGRIYTSSNAGVSWTERQPSGSVNRNWQNVDVDADGSNYFVGDYLTRLYLGLADFTDPVVSYLSPADDAVGVAVDAVFEIAFNEDVATSTGSIVLYKSSDSSIVETIDVAGALVTASSTTAFIIDPSVTLDSETGYYFMIADTAVDDLSGNSYIGISDAVTWNFTTADVNNPIVSAYFPANGAITASTTAKLILTFDEAVDVESGNITIYDSTNTVVETVAVTDFKVSGSGSVTIEIDPATTFTEQTSYYVLIDATAFDDSSSNSYAGIADSLTWAFTVGDFTDPTLSDSTPADDAINVSIDSDMVFTFNEAVDVKSGNIVIYKTVDDSVVETIDVTDPMVTGSGGTTITINPVSDLSYETEYYVLIDATAFDDSSSNSYVGIADKTTLSFTTEDTPTCPVVANAATYNAYPTCGVATCNSGYTLTGGECMANSSAGGGGYVALPSIGSGVTDTTIGMGKHGTIGAINDNVAGKNILLYINSGAGFTARASRSMMNENHYLYINHLDIDKKRIIITVSSEESKTVEMVMGDYKDVDLDGDGVSDVHLVFNDLLINRIDLTVSQLSLEMGKEIIYMENSLFKTKNSPTVYIIQNNQKHPFFNEAAFLSNGYEWKNICVSEDLSSVPTGSMVYAVLEIKSSPQLAFSFVRDLQMGMRGEDVKELQRYLNNNGFILTEGEPGASGRETDFFGRLTRQALIRFQQANNISPAIGYFGPITREKINN